MNQVDFMRFLYGVRDMDTAIIALNLYIRMTKTTSIDKDAFEKILEQIEGERMVSSTSVCFGSLLIAIVQ